MIETVISLLAPHHCYACGKIGEILCDNCKYDITLDPYARCIVCCRLTPVDSLCLDCKMPYQKAWCVGERTETLQQLVDDFKFNNTKAAHKPLAGLLDTILPVLPETTKIIPIPTIPAHIRQRGYDHAWLIASHLAKLRGLKATASVLHRAANTTQRGNTRQDRQRQAANAFTCRTRLDASVPYLIIDDVTTTGATLRYAAKALQSAGATSVWVAVVSHHYGSDFHVHEQAQTYP